MTEQDLSNLLERAADRHTVAVPPIDQMLTRTRHARKRRAGFMALAASVAVGGVIAGTTFVFNSKGTAPSPAGPATTQTPASTLPDAVHVTCSADGIHLDAKKIQTQAAGVSLVISSTLPKGSYLSYWSTGQGGVSGGDPLPAETVQRFLSLAPGTISLGCDPVDARTGLAHNGPRATFEVTDPSGYWRTDPDLARAGCDYGNGILDWKSNYFQTGSTAQKAAEAVALEFASSSQGHGASFAAHPATVGYVEASTQIWLIRKDGRPYVTVLVHRTSTGFTASPDARCDR